MANLAAAIAPRLIAVLRGESPGDQADPNDGQTVAV